MTEKLQLVKIAGQQHPLLSRGPMQFSDVGTVGQR